MSLDLGAERFERNCARRSLDVSQCNGLAEQIDSQDLFFADRRGYDASFLWESAPSLDIELMLVTQATHEASARTRNLRRI